MGGEIWSEELSPASVWLNFDFNSRKSNPEEKKGC
jgi:hypothetical protein